jgi:hypothetical protein
MSRVLLPHTQPTHPVEGTQWSGQGSVYVTALSHETELSNVSVSNVANDRPAFDASNETELSFDASNEIALSSDRPVGARLGLAGLRNAYRNAPSASSMALPLSLSPPRPILFFGEQGGGQVRDGVVREVRGAGRAVGGGERWSEAKNLGETRGSGAGEASRGGGGVGASGGDGGGDGGEGGGGAGAEAGGGDGGEGRHGRGDATELPPYTDATEQSPHTHPLPPGWSPGTLCTTVRPPSRPS